MVPESANNHKCLSNISKDKNKAFSNSSGPGPMSGLGFGEAKNRKTVTNDKSSLSIKYSKYESKESHNKNSNHIYKLQSN